MNDAGAPPAPRAPSTSGHAIVQMDASEQLRGLEDQPPIFFAGLAAWSLLLGLYAAISRGRLAFGRVFRVTHLLPAILQTVIFLYWAVYWRGMRAHAPLIAIELLYAYAFDALLAWTLGKKWEVSFGPIPIVLSTNLFVQFAARSIDLSLASVSCALLSKAFITRESGKHVFNPSAFGIGVVAIVNIAFPELGHGDNSTELNLAPNMTELVLLLGIVVQVRVRTVLVTLGAAIGLILAHMASPFSHFAPTWPPVLIVITLLATDPATIPVSSGGRLLYGLGLGFAMPFAGALTVVITGGSDFYGKVILIPIANLFSPACDRAAARIPERIAKLLSYDRNLAHIGLYLALMIHRLFTEGPKMRDLEQIKHAQYGTPLVVVEPDGRVTCERNPVFCKPFTVHREIALWMERYRAR